MYPRPFDPGLKFTTKEEQKGLLANPIKLRYTKQKSTQKLVKLFL